MWSRREDEETLIDISLAYSLFSCDINFQICKLAILPKFKFHQISDPLKP